MIARMKMNMILKSIWNGMLGIISEISTALFFMAAGFIICFLLWSFFK